MVKLLHLADIHLDSPFNNMSYSDSVKRRDDTRRIFASALGYAKKSDVSVVLISGDLFDSEFYTENTVTFLTDAFSAMPDCRFVIAPGNHDPYKFGSPYSDARFPENVYVFDSEELREIYFSDLGLRIYGYAFTSDSYNSRPIENFTVRDDCFTVLCAHADTESPISKYAPISEAELAKSRLDYAALGHVHTKKDIQKAGKTVYAYSGSLTGRDFSEHGRMGGILVKLDYKEAMKVVDTERITFCPWVYQTVTADISGASKGTLKNLLRKKLSEELQAPELEQTVRLVLTGSVDFEIDEKVLLAELSEYGVSEIENRTLSSFEFLGLSEDISIRGEFFKALKPMLSSENPLERQKAEAALRLGLKALAKMELE